MCRLLETIKLENGVLYNMKYHNLRFNNARKNLFGISGEIDLKKIISIPDECKCGIFRCRVTYSETIEKNEFIPHVPKTINSLKLVTDNEIEYSYKYADRKRLSALFEQRGTCDEIIIIKNGLVTDCSIGNLIFWDGRKWWTPSTPLLNGTQRMRLLEEGLVFEKEIPAGHIFSYQKAGIINVFYGFGNLHEIPVSSIKRLEK